MKRLIRLVCLILVFVMVMAIPANAAEFIARGSDYFMARSCYLWKTSSTQFQVWFDVTAMGIVDELGTNTIKVQRSSDGKNWEDMQTYRKADYSQMIDKNTVSHADCVTYSGAQTGYYYRAYVCFYAKDGTTIAEYGSYTSSITMP